MMHCVQVPYIPLELEGEPRRPECGSLGPLVSDSTPRAPRSSLEKNIFEVQRANQELTVFLTAFELELH